MKSQITICLNFNYSPFLLILLVRSFGTENRPVNKFVPPRDEVYEYIIFRANDIKDLIVDDPVANASALADPAIIQAVRV